MAHRLRAMAEAGTDRRAAGPPRGLLHGPAPDGYNEHRRVLPDAHLAPFVAHFWWVRWALAVPFVGETLPHPSAHVVFEESRGRRRAEITGVPKGRFVRELSGDGRVFGVKFRPGAFQPFLGPAPMVSLTGRVVPIAAVLGAKGEAWARAMAPGVGLDGAIALATESLSSCLPVLPREAAEVRDLVERMAVDRSLVRVEEAARLLGVDVRALQRSFRRYVGVTPKWVLQRYRLHEAAEQLRGEHPPVLAALAASLGYADQAHFAREFKATIGRTPRSFARTTRSSPG